MSFPTDRPRRLRRTETLRRLVRETHLTPADFIQPLFVVPGTNVKTEISSMPGQFHWSVDRVAEMAERCFRAGVPGVILFGVPTHKDEVGSAAYDDSAEVQSAVRAIKKAVPELLVITDVCLCEYTSHGHCGVIEHNEVANDSTLELLARTAVSHARAGADIIAPSDMMDGRIAAIRAALDQNGYAYLPILSYAVKYASAYYGPFRVAVDSAPQFGDRRGYQMDPANANEALREVELDLAEGADMLMVKPGIAYLDILHTIKEKYRRPTAAYHVSGEYAMIEAAAQNGWVDRKRIILETLLSFKRAGADFVLTYYAAEAAEWLLEESRHAR
ncbi:MAG: porphobilinogen synthase [Calditrichaeota bacterium]|nr:porphobilinogen synthase [Calditrichota bacterium]MCB9365590.1 porphobilinogen synthase [Calditrichota bacterium]